MNTPDPAAGEPREETAQTDPALAVESPASDVDEAPEVLEAEEPAPREPVVRKTEHEVTLVRGVRYGRIIVTFGIVGAVVAMMASYLIPIATDADYTVGQIVGFMALIGAVAGLALGGLVSVVLGAVAKRRTGTGVAIQTDVQ